MKNFITFGADFPDDSEWTVRGDPLVPRGRSVAAAIASGLLQRQVSCSEVAQHSFYGWYFIAGNGPRFRCLIQYVEPWLMICDLVPTLADRLFGRRHGVEHNRLIGEVEDLLKKDKRFSRPKRFSRVEYEASSEAMGAEGRATQ